MFGGHSSRGRLSGHPETFEAAIDHSVRPKTVSIFFYSAIYSLFLSEVAFVSFSLKNKIMMTTMMILRTLDIRICLTSVASMAWLFRAIALRHVAIYRP